MHSRKVAYELYCEGHGTTVDEGTMQHCVDNDITLEIARLFVNDLGFDK